MPNYNKKPKYRKNPNLILPKPVYMVKSQIQKAKLNKNQNMVKRPKLTRQTTTKSPNTEKA
jgi:hypothetical protein